MTPAQLGSRERRGDQWRVDDLSCVQIHASVVTAAGAIRHLGQVRSDRIVGGSSPQVALERSREAKCLNEVGQVARDR
jgi:hypothetical protein